MGSMMDDYLKVSEQFIESPDTIDHRPWGYFEILSDRTDHKVKRIVVSPGKRLSLQRHRFRSEHWTIISGTPLVTLNQAQIRLDPGNSIFIPLGAKHRITNPGDTDVVLIEVQTGSYFGEDDIERFEDDFGRLEKTCV